MTTEGQKHTEECREAFEDACERNDVKFSIQRDIENGGYLFSSTRSAWVLWRQAWNTRTESAHFQSRVKPWMDACFGPVISADKVERNHRFLEEALELVQACGATASECHQLVDYVYGRPTGEPTQEAGGVMITLAALCLANGFDMHAAGETELTRIWGKIEQIRAKQTGKPKHSPLPQIVASSESGMVKGLVEALEALYEAHVGTTHHADHPIWPAVEMARAALAKAKATGTHPEADRKPVTLEAMVDTCVRAMKSGHTLSDVVAIILKAAGVKYVD